MFILRGELINRKKAYFKFAPQLLQNFAPGETGSPQLAQTRCPTGVPHLAQNRAPGRSGLLHWLQKAAMFGTCCGSLGTGSFGSVGTFSAEAIGMGMGRRPPEGVGEGCDFRTSLAFGTRSNTDDNPKVFSVSNFLPSGTVVGSSVQPDGVMPPGKSTIAPLTQP